MNKKLLISLAIVGGILLLSNISYASSYDELKLALEAYLQDPSLDFLGREYDRILFEQINNAETLDGELLAKLNFMFDDLLTMPLQLKCMKKIFIKKLYFKNLMQLHMEV